MQVTRLHHVEGIVVQKELPLVAVGTFGVDDTVELGAFSEHGAQKYHPHHRMTGDVGHPSLSGLKFGGEGLAELVNLGADHHLAIALLAVLGVVVLMVVFCFIEYIKSCNLCYNWVRKRTAFI